MRSLAEVIGMIAGDPSCVLCLPMTPDSIQNGKVLDMSRYGNHGTVTGCVPSKIPILDLAELVTNGGGEEALGSEWATYFESGVASGSLYQNNVSKFSGSNSVCLEVADSGTNTAHVYAANRIAPGLEVGAWYQIGFWYYADRTVANARFTLLKATSPWTALVNVSIATLGASWNYFSAIFQATASWINDLLAVLYVGNNPTVEPFYVNIDDLSLRKIVGYQTGLGMYGDGVDDVVNCGNASNLVGMTDQMAFALWFYLPALNISSNKYKPFFGCRTSTQQYDAAVHNNRTIRFDTYGLANQVTVYSTGTVLPGKWNHIAGSLLSGTAKSIYINGVHDKTVVPTGGTMNATTSTFGLFGLRGGAVTTPIQAHEAFCTIWNTHRGSEVLRSHYNLTRPFIGV